MSTGLDLDAANKQVLAEAFCDLVRYALLKTRRNVDLLGVTARNFTVAAVDESLAAGANAAISGEHGAPTVERLLKRAARSPLTFHFYWKVARDGSPLEAAFDLSYEEGDLKVRLLWLDLPERVPVSPLIGAIEGRKPLEEAVSMLLRVERGRLSPYPPPA